MSRIPRPPSVRSSSRPHRERGRSPGRAALATALLVLALPTACGAPEDPADGTASPAVDASATLRSSTFRIRTDASVPLNAERGWAATTGDSTTVAADRPFRVRFELEATSLDAASGPFRLQVQRNGGPWAPVPAADFPYPDEIASPRVSVVTPSGYAGGSATDDLLEGSDLPFRPGEGVGLDSLTARWTPEPSPSGVHGEWEWPVVIRRFADGAVTNDEDDVFRFRMAEASGRPVTGSPLPAVALTVPAGHLGGTFVETPGRLGPWQASNGDLYFVMEPAETDNVLMVVRSTDGGATWREVDGANRPAADDLEGFGTTFRDGRIHMLHQQSEAVWYHAFGTADDATAPDRWITRDEPVATPSEPPVQVAALTDRPDGSLVAVYGDSIGLRIRIRSPTGAWSAERRLRGAADEILSGPQLATGAGGTVHLAYTARTATEGAVRLRALAGDGTPGAARLVDTASGAREADAGAVVPLVALPGSGEVVVLYRRSDGTLWEHRSTGDGARTEPVRVTDHRVVQNAVDSDQVGADAVGYEGTVHVLFIDEETRNLLHTRRPPTGGWEPARPVVEGIRGQWVRGAVVTDAHGSPVYGFVYDAGSDGGSGMNRYGEIPLGALPSPR